MKRAIYDRRPVEDSVQRRTLRVASDSSGPSAVSYGRVGDSKGAQGTCAAVAGAPIIICLRAARDVVRLRE